MVKLETVAIIPARSGSKRLPKKNILPISGKPMIQWTIEAAINSNCFDRIVVSTDDQDIAKLSSSCGADVPFVRKEYCDDYSDVSEVTIDALKQLKKLENQEFKNVVLLMANCPLRTAEDIRDALSEFNRHEFKGQISCFKYGWMNPWWAFKLDEQNRPDAMFPGAIEQRSQDLPELYCPTGAIWIAECETLFNENSFYTSDHKFHPLDWMSAMDIDNKNDLQMAEYLFSYREQSRV